MDAINFEPFQLPPEAETLRLEVREFLRETLDAYPPRKRAESWTGSSPEFSRKLGERGWIGMTWPKQYGGHERTAFDRYVVCEELLAAGAPVGFHWIADRQSGPLLLRFGTHAQRERLLPRIAAGEICFGIGMSEPGSGSDLASLRTRATKCDGGWTINGRKVWTTLGHEAQYLIALVRTAPQDPKHRHDGLTQFIIDMTTPGITVSPVVNMIGEHHFNEIVFDDVLVPDDAVVGGEGEGWKQVTAELAYERSGPERYLSSHLMLNELVRQLEGSDDPRAHVEVGRLVARLATLRRMSVSVAGMLEGGASPALEGAVVKSLGVSLEQDLPVLAEDLTGLEPSVDTGSDFQQVLGYLSQAAVSFSLRGGTPEIMRGIIARGLSLR
ncbi:MAG: acyl-CoA dehydrogenase family protein [Pseudomonadota bacterium]